MTTTTAPAKAYKVSPTSAGFASVLRSSDREIIGYVCKVDYPVQGPNGSVYTEVAWEARLPHEVFVQGASFPSFPTRREAAKRVAQIAGLEPQDR